MQRSKHNLSHYHLAIMNMGDLYPVACLEVLPGDSIRHATSALLRVTPLVAPVMHPVHVHIHHWFTPSRLLWDGWEDFITDASGSDTVPTVDADDCEAIANAFGIGAENGTSVDVNALPFRAYNRIYNEFYRDQDLTTAITESTGDTDSGSNYSIRKVSWEKDYFTTARANAQQGDTMQVSFASGTAPVLGIAAAPTNAFNQTASGYKEADGGSASGSDWTEDIGNTAGEQFVIQGNNSTKVPNIRADLSQATASFDINEWRRSMAFQKIRENRNRYGSRYRDMLAFLGISSPDARMDRPEYLGGGRQTVSFSEVLSTYDDGTTSTIGNLAGHGIAAMRTRPYKRFFQEHGYIQSLMFVRPKTVYQDQVPRQFLRSVWSDFWQKELEMMGEQAVTNVEVRYEHASPAGVFGYVPRHEDYRRHPSYVSGGFRTSDFNSWHMARDYASDPALNAAFVQCDPTNRVFSTTAVDELQSMLSHAISARRLVSKRSRN